LTKGIQDRRVPNAIEYDPVTGLPPTLHEHSATKCLWVRVHQTLTHVLQNAAIRGVLSPLTNHTPNFVSKTRPPPIQRVGDGARHY
jgi:hypothetical protein